MNKLFLILAFLLIGLVYSSPSSAQTVAKIPQSSIKPQGGIYGRKGPCGTLDGYNCGSNPPRYQLTPAMCGWMFSTSQARNSGGATDFSTRGIRFILPTVATLNSAGYTPNNLSAASGYANREGACTYYFVEGAPGPENYLEIAIDGVQGTDKLTSFAQGSYDIFNGSLVWPYRTPGVLGLTFNGFSWLVTQVSPSLAERINQGQMSAHGQGRLFLVTQNPTWWTSDTLVGSLAYCPYNGLGLNANANGGTQLSLTPALCTFKAPGTGTAVEYVGYRNVTSGIINGLEAGAAYPAGTAPNGEAYAAGNYVVLVVGASSVFTNNNQISVHNVPSNLGTVAEGNWIGRFIDSTHIELHERIFDHMETSKFPIGPPSSFVAGDALKSAPGYPGYNSATLSSVSLTGGRYTNMTSGTEAVNQANADTLVGMASRVSGAYQDTPTNRRVSSWFNPLDKRCQSGLSATRTVSASTYTEANSEIRCNAVVLNRVPTVAANLGDQAAGVRYTFTGTVSNSVAGQGCRVAVAFDVPTTPETDTAVLATSATAGAKTPLTISGVKTGLTETVHYGTVSMQTTGSGVCTMEADARLALDLRM